MYKKLLVVFAVMLLASVLAGCASKPGDALITVKGDIGKTNSGNDYVLDQATFDSKSVALVYDDPWMGDGLEYKGILLKDLVDMVNPGSGATVISLVATDGKAFDIAMSDAKNYDIMLARWVDGQPLTESNGGPVKVAYPATAGYPDEDWAWWIVSINIK